MDILIEELEGSIWAAALDDGRLEGLEIDTAFEEVRWGSVYWARVETIDKAQDAVYLNLDGDNTGILYNKDVRLIAKDGSIKKGGDEAIGKILKPGQMITVQAKTSYMPSGDENSRETQENKIPQMSMDITIPGRYLVFCPMMKGNLLSSRIRDKKLRKQMTEMIDQMGKIEGCILRAASTDVQTDVLIREGIILHEAWEQMQKYLTGDEAGLIMLGPDAVQRTLSDNANKTINAIEIVTMEHFSMVEEWCSVFAPDLVTKIHPLELKNAKEDMALYHERDIMGQIEALLHAYVFLQGGGNIIVQETAALTAIDINRGPDKRGNLAINIEAAKEVARQIRLRNLGGIITVDFLRLSGKAEEEQLKTALEEAINLDPCTVQLHGRTPLGLFEITRKRRMPPLADKISGFLE